MEGADHDLEHQRVVLGPLRENLPFLTRALRAYIRAENADFYQALDAEQGEIVVLSVIKLNPGMSQNELADALVFKKSAVTKLVKDLEARGLVERTKSATDKRFNALQLTDPGEQRYQRISTLIAAQNAALLEPFSETEREALFTYLNRLYVHLGQRHMLRTGKSPAIAESGDD
ncbi:MarR family winged helix-turn-helix transcriptional regulator [Halodurantibacterium flavum]|uniref:MarR family winged helix-turn-helix transcriptional regulator n=1 Tax=Halodurantibacterium flavum TaxID=1382802 RepID=A0ABW4S441_9RHOB